MRNLNLESLADLVRYAVRNRLVAPQIPVQFVHLDTRLKAACLLRREFDPFLQHRQGLANTSPIPR
jgi:hypothetical protein